MRIYFHDSGFGVATQIVFDISKAWANIRKGVFEAGKEVETDEEGSIDEGGCVLGRHEESGERSSSDVMPQVKELKELDVAGSATAIGGRYGDPEAPVPRLFRVCLFF